MGWWSDFVAVGAVLLFLLLALPWFSIWDAIQEECSPRKKRK